MFKIIAKQSSTQKDNDPYLFQRALTQPKQELTMRGSLILQKTINNQADAKSFVQKSTAFRHDFSRIPVHRQPKSSSDMLTISEPGAKYEQEADQAAERVMNISQPNQSDQQHTVSHNTESVHSTASNNLSGGNALDPETRQFFEPRFDHNFANVRVYSDHSANETARGLGARAYTVGEDITFASNEYRPSTYAGKQLLAHELAHVVQQNRTPNRERSHSLSASLSRAPSHLVQRKLVATGDAAGFADLANAVIAVQFKVTIGAGGEVSLAGTNVQGPPTPEAQVLVNTIRSVINDGGTTSIEFIHGTTSTVESDRRVMGGSFPQSKVDLDDEAVLGTQESIGLGQGATAGAVLAHEIQEQFNKQRLNQGFDDAHAAALAVEEQAVGAARNVTQRSIPGGTEVTYTYNYPNGRVVVLKFDIKNGARTNVRRTVTP